jgi:hypothetical protein
LFLRRQMNISAYLAGSNTWKLIIIKTFFTKIVYIHTLKECEMEKIHVIDEQTLESAMSYAQYTKLLGDLAKQGKTTGTNQSSNMVSYGKLNFQRLKRVYKTAELTDELKATIANIKNSMVWIALTEGWCGDAAQNLPPIALMSELTDKIDFKLLLRDEHPEVMDAYLTNGGRSIPKMIVFRKSDLEELGTWGPRPTPFQKRVMDYKENPNMPYEAFTEELHKKYNQDKTLTLQKEFVTLIQKWDDQGNQI